MTILLCISELIFYLCSRSSSCINLCYIVYQEDDINEENNPKADNDEDDYLLEPRPEPMSVTEKLFTYSASPGFLQDHLSSTPSPRVRLNI